MIFSKKVGKNKEKSLTSPNLCVIVFKRDEDLGLFFLHKILKRELSDTLMEVEICVQKLL